MYSKIFASASKVVFILMAVAAVVLTFMKIVDAKDFIILTSMAFSFYFSSKQTDADGRIIK